MKKLILQLSLFLFIFPIGISASSIVSEKQASTTNNSFDYYVRVVKIVDGDTFIGLTNDKKEVHFRLQGIDAPEKGQPFSGKSKEKLAELIAGKYVGIKAQQNPDRYGRLIVWAYTPEGKDVSAEMLKTGFSWHFRKYDNSAFYSQLETEARKNRSGLWSDANPIAPWNFRKEHNTNNSKNFRLYP